MQDPSILVGTQGLPTGSDVAAAHAAVGANAQLQEAEQKNRELESTARVLASALEIHSQLDSCGELETASRLACRLIADSTGSSRVMMAWRPPGKQRCRLLADTGDDMKGDATQAFCAAAEEFSARDGITIFPPKDHDNRHALLTVRAFVQHFGSQPIVACRMLDATNKVRGVLIAIGPFEDHDTQGLDQVALQLSPLGPTLGKKLTTIEALQPRIWERLVRRVFDPAVAQKRRVFLACLAIAIVVLCLPMPYNITARCELQPTLRRYVAAPFDGPLESVRVQPGDLVQSGDLLAKINPREIEYELAGLRAELRQAIQQKKSHMAEHDFGKGRIATLETQRLQAEQELLQHQRDNLEIHSPISGVIVSGDLMRSIGAPFAKGDPMFEIAPMGELVVELSISESDFRHARVGMPVQFLLDALPSQKLAGTLEKLYPQAELRDNKNVFIGEVSVRDPDGVLRPGMRGRAWIKSDHHPLGWNLFHRAFYSLRQWTGW